MLGCALQGAFGVTRWNRTVGQRLPVVIVAV